MTTTIIESSYVQRFTVAPDATLAQFLAAWGRAYVVKRSWRMTTHHPPTLVEAERVRCELEVNRDLERAERPERVRIIAELSRVGMELMLQWELRNDGRADIDDPSGDGGAAPLTHAELMAAEAGEIGCRCARLIPEVKRARADRTNVGDLGPVFAFINDHMRGGHHAGEALAPVLLRALTELVTCRRPVSTRRARRRCP